MIAYGGVSVMSTARTDRTQIFHTTANGLPWLMCWSPDGEHLAVEIRRRVIDR